jgi:hypothetical protein
MIASLNIDELYHGWGGDHEKQEPAFPSGSCFDKVV